MAKAATCVFELRTTGSDTNGGFYNPVAATTDYSQQDAPQLSLTDVVTNGTSTVTSVVGGFTAAMVGNGINIAGVTYEILTRVDTNTITVDQTIGAASGQTGKVGGALLTPGYVGSQMVAGNDFHWKSGLYIATSATPNIAGGCLTLPAGASAANTTKVIGYQTTRGDGGTKPIFRADGVITTFTLITTGTSNRVENIEVDGNLRSSSRGFNLGVTFSMLYRCRGRNCTNNAFVANSNSGAGCNLCEGTGCTTQAAFANCFCFFCTAYSNTSGGFVMAVNYVQVFNCIAWNNTGIGFVISSGTVAMNCTAYGNSSHGFSRTAATASGSMVNCVAVNNGGYGFTATAADDNFYLHNCAAYGNTSGDVNTSLIPAGQQIGFISLTGDPFTNAAGADFSLNNDGEVFGGSPGTDRRGRWLRGAGSPGTFPGSASTSSLDVGAVQHADAGTGVIISNAGLMGGLV